LWLEDQAQHGEKVGDHVAVHESVAGPSRHFGCLVAVGGIADIGTRWRPEGSVARGPGADMNRECLAAMHSGPSTSDTAQIWLRQARIHSRRDTVPGQRQEIVDRLSSLKGFAALILSPRAAGMGLNIVAANHVIHLDRWWNPAVEDQCTDRAYRIGATKDVFVHTIGAVHPQLRESSYDVILDQLLRTRRETSKRIFTASDIIADDFVKILQQAGERLKEDVLIERPGWLSRPGGVCKGQVD
jgi:hypothetical protein